jgi:alkylated DNA repair dioxygenase AlkB
MRLAIVEDFTDNDIIKYELENNGHIEFCEKFLSDHFSKKLFDSLVTLDFKQSEIKMTDKVVLTPRLQAWMGDVYINASVYTRLKPNPWTKEMLILKNKLEEITQFVFDYVLINYYRNVKDYIAYHSDREAIGEGKNVICSISLGATRKFVLKHIDKNIPKRSFILENGSLIIMKGDDTQKYWKHTITKTTLVDDPRINLTFRHS